MAGFFIFASPSADLAAIDDRDGHELGYTDGFPSYRSIDDFDRRAHAHKSAGGETLRLFVHIAGIYMVEPMSRMLKIETDKGDFIL